MLDRDQVVRDTLAQLPPTRLQRRRRALAEAHELLRDRLGSLDEPALRRVMALFNQDVNFDREVQGRFATGLVGRNANLLVNSLHNVNELVPQLWRADDPWLATNLVAVRRSGRLAGGGWLFLSLVLHAREPQRFVPRTTAMSRGLAALEGQPMLAFRSGGDYLEYCRRVHTLLAAHAIDPHGADVLLFNGDRLARANGMAAEEDDEDLAAAPTVGPEPRVHLTGPSAGSPLGPEPRVHLTGPFAGSPLAAAPTVGPEPRPAVASGVSAAPAAPRSFGWLHLTDLHQGMGGTSWLWPNVKAQLFADLERLHAVSGPWDLVFFTGDLTQRGTREEFDQLDRTLEQLWARLEKLGPRPQLVAVPGNHDLTRPSDPFDPVVLALQQWHNNRRLRDHVIGGPDNPYRATLRAAFAAYEAWARSGRWSSARRIEGALPGDVALSLPLNGLDVGVIGLNSAFLQLTDGDFLEKLDVDPQQLHAVCGHDAPEWLQQHHVNFLLTHHPPAWLAPQARREFNAEIDVPGRFAAHFYGHMHEGASASLSVGGAAARHTLQGASLFGMEEYQSHDGRRMQRIHGYSAGRFELGAPGSGRVQLFPRRMIDNKLGRRIERDQDNYELDDRGAFGHDVPVPRTAVRTGSSAPYR